MATAKPTPKTPPPSLDQALKEVIGERLDAANEMRDDRASVRDGAWNYAKGYGDALRGILLDIRRWTDGR